MRKPRNSVLGGLAALPVRLRFCLALLAKRLRKRARYPLLFLSRSRGGFLKTLELRDRLRLKKVIRVGRKYHFSLLEPRWPSEAYDRMIAGGGLNLGAAGTAAKAQIDLAVLAITRTCPYRCRHCCERYNLGPEEQVPASRWRQVIGEIQEIGVSVVALSGGEPLTAFDRTLDLLLTADKSRSDFHLFTAGAGASTERVRALVDAGLAAAAVGLDDYDTSRYDRLRGQPGAFDQALRAIRLFVDAGILVYVNVCLTRDLIRDAGLHRLHELLRRLGVGAVQLLEPKPCGGNAGGVESPYGPGERAAVRDFFETAHASRRYASFPVVYYPAFMETPENLGCMMGGLSQLYVDSLGNVQPCVFLPVSFGNVLSESFGAIYARLRRAVPQPLHRPCPAVRLARQIGFGAGTPGRLPIPYNSVRREWREMST